MSIPTTAQIAESPLEQSSAMTLEQMLQALSAADDDLAVQFDPDQIVGDIRSKVDAIRFVIKLLEGRSSTLKADAVALSNKAYAIAKNAERLESYVVRAMVENNFEKLPGNRWVLRRQRNAPALKMLRHEPTDLDRELYPDLVEEIPARLAWRNDRIKDGLKSEALKGCDFAELTYGHQIRWDVNVPEPDHAALDTPPAKKPRKKKEP